MTEVRQNVPAEALFRYMEKLDFPAQYRPDFAQREASFSRRTGDIGGCGNGGKGPVWWYPMEKMYSDEDRPSAEALADMKQRLRAELDRVFGPVETGADEP